MALSLYDVTVPSFLQILAAVRGYLGKAAAYAFQTRSDPEVWVETSLIHDMWPLRDQIVSVVHHSSGALQSVEIGTCYPPLPSQENFAGLQALVADAEASVGRYTRPVVNSFEGQDVIFRGRLRTLPFLAEDFLLSYSLPNFYFHAATAYDILRMIDVPLGKLDYLGRMRVRSE